MEYQREELTKTLMDLGIVDISEVNMDDYEDVAENPEVSDSLSRIASELIHISSSLDIINKYSPAKNLYLRVVVMFWFLIFILF